MNDKTHASDFPAPSIPSAQDGVVRYTAYVGSFVYVKIEPYEGMSIGQKPVIQVRFSAGGSTNWAVEVKTQRELIDGLSSGFTREHLKGSTSLTVSFMLGSKGSEIRTYAVEAPANEMT